MTMEVRLACACLFGGHWGLWRLGWPVGVFLELTLVKLIEVGSSACCGWLTLPRQRSEKRRSEESKLRGKQAAPVACILSWLCALDYEFDVTSSLKLLLQDFLAMLNLEL